MGSGYPISLGVIHRVPKYGTAVIAPEKLTKYLLDTDNSKGKSAFFESIGYTKENADQLAADLRKGLSENGAEASIKSAAGERVYNVIMELGIGKRAQVLTAWQADHEGDAPRFITAFPAKRKK